MTLLEREIVAQLADAYRILREAYWYDMHGERPPLNDLQKRVKTMLETRK